MKIDNFFAELKRRNVYKVAVAYIVAGWALAQGIAQVLPVFEIANWVIRLLVVLIMIGLPIALCLAWAFELDTRRDQTHGSGAMPCRHDPPEETCLDLCGGYRRLLSIGLFFLGRYSASKQNALPDISTKSIAVLPFENLSGDPENAYFSEGIQERS